LHADAALLSLLLFVFVLAPFVPFLQKPFSKSKIRCPTDEISYQLKAGCLAAGASCSACVIADGGRVFSWGLGAAYVLGHGDAGNQALPKEVETLRFARITQVVLGHRHAAAVSAEGVLYTWGSGAHGRLGHGDLLDREVPVAVDFFVEKARRVERVSACIAQGAATACVCSVSPG